MSTITLSTERWGDIAASLVHYGTQGDEKSAPMITGELCRAIGISPFSPADERRFAFLAFVFDAARLNAAAYAVRYESDRPQVTLAKPGRVMHVAALLKAVRCAAYNCDAGRDHAGTVAKLDAVVDALKDIVIESVPSYAEAGWSETERQDLLTLEARRK